MHILCSKKLLGLLHCRLKLLKRKEHSIVRQLREDIAQLLKNGQNDSAFARVGTTSFIVDFLLFIIIFFIIYLFLHVAINYVKVEIN